MDGPSKKLVVMGDRVLVTPEEGEERTSVGLYLPPTAVERQAVQSGRIDIICNGVLSMPALYRARSPALG